jgi:uncharacterized UBP type Zn finger protein
MREIKTHSSYSYYGGQKYTTYGQVFGLPIVVTVPRAGCTYSALYDTIRKQMNRYVRRADQDILFEMNIINSYGSQEVQKLNANSEQILQLTSNTYIGCDWETDMKDNCYDIQKATTYEIYDSCKATGTLADLLMQNETLEEEDGWFCPNCKGLAKGYRNTSLWKLPFILVIRLKRFPDSKNKIETKVNFPLKDLELCLSEKQVPLYYDLCAVINHHGDINDGHYTAYSMNEDTGKWYKFDNNSYVTQLDADPNIICSSASYVLFYQLNNKGKSVYTIVSHLMKKVI